MALGSLQNYRDKFDDPDDNTSDGRSCKCKTKTGKTPQRPPRPSQPPPGPDGT